MKKFLVIFSVLLKLDFISTALFPPTSPTRHQFVVGIGVPLQLKEEAITLGYLIKAQYFLVRNFHSNLNILIQLLIIKANDISQLKFQFFPDIFADNKPDFLWNMKWTKFPNAARRYRREIETDSLTGQKYESYQVNVEQIGDEPLNETSVNWMTKEDDEEFDDKFEDDIEDEEMFSRENYENVENQIQDEDDEEFHLPRWTIYDAIGKYLTAKGFHGRECVLKSICEAQRTPFGDNLFEELFQIFFT